MGKLRQKTAVLLSTALFTGICLSACANAPDTASLSTGAAPGVTNAQISVGALATQTGGLAADFAAIVPGVKAYFSWVNSQGGVWGRKIVLTHAADDAGIPSNNATQARVLVQQDHVFAIVGVATAFFTAAKYLASTGTPTFGYATQEDWAGPKNLFAAYGSYIDFATGGPDVAYSAMREHASSVALMAYNVPQSQQSCQVASDSMKRHGIKVGFEDLSVPFGGDMSSDVLRMKAAKVDYVAACFDVNGNLQLARTIRQNGMGEVPQFWLDGYNSSTLAQNGSLMANTFFLVQHVPFQAAQEFPGAFPGLETYLRVMKKYAPAEQTSEAAMEGWISAATFVAGLRIAGKHPTQSAVVKAINQMSAFTAGGVMLPVDWRISHTSESNPSCTSYAKTVSTNGGQQEFRVAYNKGTNVWTCFPLAGPTSLSKTVPPPSGAPGV